MAYSGHPNQYQSPAYNPQVHGAAQPPHGYHAPPGYNTGAPAAQYGAPPPSYAGYNPAQGAYQSPPPPTYVHVQAAHTGGYTAHTGGYSAPAGGYSAPAGGYTALAGAYTAPPGYGQQTQYGAPPPATNPAATNPYSTAHTGAPGYHHPQPPPVPTEPPCPPGVDPTLWQVFKVVDANNSNSITAIELQQALTNNNWTQFNAETCRLLIGQFDQNKDGSIDIYEFSHLWKYIQEWRSCFEGFDTDRSGTIDVNELQQAFNSFGYRLSMEFCQLCTRVFDRSDKHSMNFDSFIQCCVLMRSLTDSFRRRDTNQNGQIDVSYEDFLEMVIDNTVNN